jgi:hypothetical protein
VRGIPRRQGQMEKIWRKIQLYFLFLILACLMAAVNAYGLRCGNDLVDVGDRKIDVLKKCGEPVITDDWYEENTFRRSQDVERLGEGKRRSVMVHVEEWTYNFGPTRFMYILTFKNGELVEIKTGDHGF